MMHFIPAATHQYPLNIEEIRGQNDPEAMKAVAREMESLFAYELIKAMRSTAEASPAGNLRKSAYMSMFDMELARLFAERGLGLQDLVLKEMQKNAAGKERSQDAGHFPADGVNSARSLPQQAPLVFPPSLPVQGIITSPFGTRRHPIYSDLRFHYGIDIAAPTGTDIFPVKPGRVVYSGQQAGYGNIVIIDHGGGLISKYAHNKCNLVQEGDTVSTETAIAQVGETGSTTGPHLHFEIMDDGIHVDPARMFAWR